MPNVPVVSLDNVSFSYGFVPALEHVSLTVHEFDSICIVGPNGGGKTTLLKLILGLLRPDAGEIRVFGERPERARRRIGYIPQYVHYDPQFPVTIMDVVLMGRLGRRLGGPYSRADRTAALTAIGEVGLADLPGRLFNSLSGGQRQRALIARALVAEPDLLLLDEPTANVDVAVGSQLHAILGLLKRRVTILMVTHDLAFVSNIVSRVACVNRNVVVHSTSEVSIEMIHSMYGEDVRLVRHDTGLADGERRHV